MKTINIINKGYIEPVIKPEDYHFGAGLVPEVILQEDGDWSNFTPEGEIQNKQFETDDCTGFATLNALEILTKRTYGKEANYSDRFLGTVAGTTRNGNDPKTVTQALRDNGAIPEEMMPFSPDLQTPEEYYSFKGVNEAKCRDEGKKWKATHDYKYEWVVTPGMTQEARILAMKNALKLSPLTASVTAWILENGLYIDNGLANCHDTDIIAYREGLYWLVYDSYPVDGVYFKHLAWDHNIMFAQRHHLAEVVEDTRSFLQRIAQLVALLKNFFIPVNLPPLVVVPDTTPPPNDQTLNGLRLYNEARKNEGKYLTLNKAVPIELNCAQTISFLLKQAGVRDIPALGFEGTKELCNFYETSGWFKEITEKEALPGDLIIAVTGSSGRIPPILEHGHAGEVMKTCIFSNDSATGTLEGHFSLETWKEKYENYGGFKSRYFRVK